MSQSLDSLMTPEQARQMYAALLERLPPGSVPAQSIEASFQPDFVSVSNRQPQAAAPVTQGIAATAQQPADDLPMPPPPPPEAAAAASPTAPQGEVDALARLRELAAGDSTRPTRDETSRDALSNFFFSMAGSRSPSFFAQLGEAGQAMLRSQNEARTAARQERQVDAETAYRAAAEARQLRELANLEDPNTPRGRLLAAQARQAEAHADYYTRQAANVGAERRDANRLSGTIVGEDGILYGTDRQGQIRPYTTPSGEPFRRGQTENWQTQWTSIYNNAVRRLSEFGPGQVTDPNEVSRRAAAEANAGIEAMRRSLGRPGAAPAQAAPTAAQTSGGPAIVIDPSNRPVR